LHKIGEAVERANDSAAARDGHKARVARGHAFDGMRAEGSFLDIDTGGERLRHGEENIP
jgi:hypothetical protein